MALLDLFSSQDEDAREIEILIFNVDRYRLGINMGKVREIIRMPVIKSVPYSHPVISGLFQLRDRLIPSLNLKTWLELEAVYPPAAKVIIAEFLGLKVGFLVDSVERIHRVRWADIVPPDCIKRFTNAVLGTVKQEKRLINLIDFEQLVLDINPVLIGSAQRESWDNKELMEKRRHKSIWIVDDSPTIRDFLKGLLVQSGYTDIIFLENGKHALDTLAIIKKNRQAKVSARERVDLIISDIEMPVLDGYGLTHALKEDEILGSIPVILFSSMITSENKLKGEIVKADAQLAKSESVNLVGLMDRFLFS